MTSPKLPEVWLRGPLPGFHPTLQPLAHALLQAREEVEELMEDFPPYLLWERLYELASPAFHLQHLAGVLDRLFTYARGEALRPEQLLALREEGVKKEDADAHSLVLAFHHQVDRALEQLQATDGATLHDHRGVGRAQLPSTVLGLYTHAAEHTMRHVGQLLVTVRVLRGNEVEPVRRSSL